MKDEDANVRQAAVRLFGRLEQSENRPAINIATDVVLRQTPADTSTSGRRVKRRQEPLPPPGSGEEPRSEEEPPAGSGPAYAVDR
jgi:hypothetical protein